MLGYATLSTAPEGAAIVALMPFVGMGMLVGAVGDVTEGDPDRTGSNAEGEGGSTY